MAHKQKNHFPICFTRPVSSTGSLWTGYGGWLYRTCSFALRKRNLKRKTYVFRKVCYIMRTDEDIFLSQPIVSRRIRTREPFGRWERIDHILMIARNNWQAA